MISSAAGCLPVCINERGELMFLFGLESPCESSAKGWSDFAGSMEKDDKNVYKAALREMSEETSGFLGSATDIDQLIKANGGFLRLVYDNSGSKYHIHIFKLDYDEKLLKYYNANHKYLYKKVNHDLLKSTKVFEKIRLEWFTVDMMRHRRKEFRPFYRIIVDNLINESITIKEFLTYL